MANAIIAVVARCVVVALGALFLSNVIPDAIDYYQVDDHQDSREYAEKKKASIKGNFGIGLSLILVAFLF